MAATVTAVTRTTTTTPRSTFTRRSLARGHQCSPRSTQRLGPTSSPSDETSGRVVGSTSPVRATAATACPTDECAWPGSSTARTATTTEPGDREHQRTGHVDPRQHAGDDRPAQDEQGEHEKVASDSLLRCL